MFVFMSLTIACLPPRPYIFTGVAAAAEPGLAPSSGPSSSLGSDAEPEHQPLEAESHWRLFSAASFMRTHLGKLVQEEGLNLQDFMFHV